LYIIKIIYSFIFARRARKSIRYSIPFNNAFFTTYKGAKIAFDNNFRLKTDIAVRHFKVTNHIFYLIPKDGLMDGLMIYNQGDVIIY